MSTEQSLDRVSLANDLFGHALHLINPPGQTYKKIGVSSFYATFSVAHDAVQGLKGEQAVTAVKKAVADKPYAEQIIGAAEQVFEAATCDA